MVVKVVTDFGDRYFDAKDVQVRRGNSTPPVIEVDGRCVELPSGSEIYVLSETGRTLDKARVY